MTILEELHQKALKCGCANSNCHQVDAYARNNGFCPQGASCANSTNPIARRAANTHPTVLGMAAQ